MEVFATDVPLGVASESALIEYIAHVRETGKQLRVSTGEEGARLDWRPGRVLEFG